MLEKMRILKPKKEDYIELGNRVSIAPQHLKILEGDPKKREKLVREIARICLIKNVHYILNQNDHFVIFDRMY